MPYRNQLNFTFEGLKSAASSVEKLRNFRFRLTSATLAAGTSPAMSALASETVARITSALDDDLNTAQAQAAIFDMVRRGNAALDADEMRKMMSRRCWERSTSSTRYLLCSRMTISRR